MDQHSVGFIGLGNLGSVIADNLLKSGRLLHIYNRTREKAIPYQQQGAVIAASVPELAKNCQLVFSLVSDDAALRSITDGPEGLAAHLAPGAIHISMSTVSPEISASLNEMHRVRGSHYLAAPIMGRPEAAIAKTLGICLSGDREAKERLKGYWEDLGASKVYDFGEEPASANVVKLCVNFLLASSVEAMAEAFALAGSHGVSTESLYSLLIGGLFNCPVIKNYGRFILDKKFEPASFTVNLGLKDISLVLKAAKGHSASMGLAEVVKERLEQSVDKGRGDWDFSSFSLIAGEKGSS